MKEGLVSYKTAKLAKEKGFEYIPKLHPFMINREGVVLGKTLNSLKLTDSKGYSRVSLRVDGRSKWHLVHRLVALTFLNNPEGKPEVNHINGVRNDNRLENLEWCTHQENQAHSYRELGRKGYWNGKGGFDHPNSKPVIQMETCVVFGSAPEAERTVGIPGSTIQQCCKGKRNTAGGFRWSYYTPNKIIKAAIDLGFKKYCNHKDDEEYFIWMSLLQKWLREEHNFYIGCIKSIDLQWSCHIDYQDKDNIWCNRLFIGESYEEVLELALYEALKLIN